MEKDKKEFDFLKKCNRQIIIFKIIAIALALFIIFGWGFNNIQKIYKYKNGKYVYSIISKVYESTQEFKNQNNFLFSFGSEEIKFNYYYKDKKFKQKYSYSNGIVGCDLIYGKKSDDNVITINVWNYMKTIKGSVGYDGGKEDKEYLFENTFRYLDNLMKKNMMECGEINVYEEIYDDVECYVLKGYIENKASILVIDKTSMLILKYATLISIDGNYSWTNYKYKSGIITDEDLKMINLEEYKIDETIEKYVNEF